MTKRQREGGGERQADLLCDGERERERKRQLGVKSQKEGGRGMDERKRERGKG